MAPARNGTKTFGWVTRLLHWTMAAGVVAMLGLGSYIASMEVSLQNLWLFGLHKTGGIVLLGLVCLRLCWHLASSPPQPIEGSIRWHGFLARTVHRAFYLLLVAIPLSGLIASAATGLDVVLFGTWTLPRLAPVSERWELVGFMVHGALTKLLIALVAVHVSGALLRRDGTLRRMVSGSPGAEPSRHAPRTSQ